jgi:hypothetical protein
VSTPTEPWAKVPESLADAGLDATAMRVFVILASKAGRSRLAWISQKTIAERLRIDRRTVGHAMRRLEHKGLIRPTGTVVVDPVRGTWVKRYEVAPYLHVGHPEFPTGDAMGDPMDTDEDPMDISGGPDGHPGRAQSTASKAVPPKQ